MRLAENDCAVAKGSASRNLRGRLVFTLAAAWKAVKRGALPVAMRWALLARARPASNRDGSGRKKDRTAKWGAPLD